MARSAWSRVTETSARRPDDPVIFPERRAHQCHGRRCARIWSYTTRADADNTLALGPGTVIDTQDGIGLQLSGGDHRVMLEDTDIMARQGGNAEDGVLLHMRPAKVTSGGVVTMVETGQVDLSASASALNGHVIAASGTLDMRLSNGSTLSGAIRRVERDASTTWRWTARARGTCAAIPRWAP